MTPETRYARSGDVNIAYQVVGDAPRDLVLVPGWVSNIEVLWEEAACARFLGRLASFTRLILFDKRGTGLSDRVADLPNLETRMDDVRAVMDTVGSERAALFGYSEGGPMCALFAATYPARTAALITAGSYARRTWAPDYPWAVRPEQHRQFMERCRGEWGGPVGLDERWPSAAQDERVRQWWAKLLRMGASPAANLTLLQMNAEMDVRHVLPAIRVPTLILHSAGDRTLPIGGSRFMAEQIPGSQASWSCRAAITCRGGKTRTPSSTRSRSSSRASGTAPSPTGCWRPCSSPTSSAPRSRPPPSGIADGETSSRDTTTSCAASSGASGAARSTPRATGSSPPSTARRGPSGARARSPAGSPRSGSRSAPACTPARSSSGSDKVSGLAVHIGARVAAAAGPGEVLVSSTVKDLVAGSGLRFQDRGLQNLKGVPGEWHLFALEAEGRHA